MLATTATPPASFASTGGAEHAEDAADGEANDAASPRPAAKSKRNKKKRRRRRPVVIGRVVPDESLRKTPLERPSGRIEMYAPGTGDSADINIYNADGSYNLDALAEANRVLRCRRTDSEKPIEPRLLALLSHVYDHFGKPLEIISGYRNQRKKTSYHYKASATDVRIKGVRARELKHFAETLDAGGMGIGIYPRSNFIHIDVRPPPSYRWIDYSPPNPNAPEKRPPRGWKRKKLQS